jgi:hypothetical protein
MAKKKGAFLAKLIETERDLLHWNLEHSKYRIPRIPAF